PKRSCRKRNACSVKLWLGLLETGYPLFIWLRKTRTFWLVAIVAMHLAIGLTMGLYLFALVMITLNLAAFGPNFLFAGPGTNSAGQIDASFARGAGESRPGATRQPGRLCSWIDRCRSWKKNPLRNNATP
ncbi:MAG: hypothetical protein ABI871_04115, partial [Chthoniobacterales bacterium]